MSILIKNNQHYPVPVQKIRKIAQTLLNVLGYLDSELSILIADDLAISKLNKLYLKKDGPTNVIAFPMCEGDFCEVDSHLMGDVAISIGTVKREAICEGVNMLTRFVELLIHGILHLVGYDHLKSEFEATEMDNVSRSLLNLIQIEFVLL